MSQHYDCDQCGKRIEDKRYAISEANTLWWTTGGDSIYSPQPVPDFCSLECLWEHLGQKIGAKIVTAPRPRVGERT